MIRDFLCGAAFVITVSSCNRDTDSRSDRMADSSHSSAQVTTTVTPPMARAGNSCEHTGLWAECSIERRLKQSGFVVKKLDEETKRAGFSVTPTVYSLGSSRLEVFIYDDEKSLRDDIASLDTVAVAPKGTTASWPSPPTFIRSANLAAVLLTQNQRQAERVILSITAGPPQPGSPR
jgi:hypothetical protein